MFLIVNETIKSLTPLSHCILRAGMLFLTPWNAPKLHLLSPCRAEAYRVGWLY